MKVFCFAAGHRDHLVIAHAVKGWAVSMGVHESFAKSLRTKAHQVRPGDLAVFWINQGSPHTPRAVLTMPSIITASPDQERVCRDGDPWPGEWRLPFKISPLGSFRRFMSKDRCLSELEILKEKDGIKPNISRILHLSGNMVFSPVRIGPQDVEHLLVQLSEGQSVETIRSIVERVGGGPTSSPLTAGLPPGQPAIPVAAG